MVVSFSLPIIFAIIAMFYSGIAALCHPHKGER